MANPGPMIIGPVVALTACVDAVYAGLLPLGSAPLLIGILIACSISQIIGGVTALQKKDIVLGSISVIFGTVITLGATITLWQTLAPGPRPIPEVMGVFWIVLFLAAEGYEVAFGRMSWLLFAGIADVGVAFLLLGLSSLGGGPVHGVIAGYLLLAFAAFCLCSATAMLWGENFQRPVPPLGKPLY